VADHRTGVMTADGVANSTRAQPPITVEHLKTVKDGYENLKRQVGQSVQTATVVYFPAFIIALTAMARHVGGFKALACCCDSLARLAGNADFEVLARCATALSESLSVKIRRHSS